MGMFDYPEDQMGKAAMPDEDYMRDRQIEEMHRTLENMRVPKKREAPVEAQQAHRIGFLEAEVKNAHERGYEENQRANRLQKEVEQLRAERDTLARDLKVMTKDRDEWQVSSSENERLYKNLVAKRRKR